MKPLDEKFPESERLEDDTPKAATFAPTTGNAMLDMNVSGLVSKLFPEEDFSDDDDDNDELKASESGDTAAEEVEQTEPDPAIVDDAQLEAKKDEPKADDKTEEPTPPVPQPDALKGLFEGADENADLVGLAAQEIATLRKTVEEERSASDRLSTIFESNPEIAGLVRALDKGASFIEALASTVNLEEVVPDPTTDPEGYRDYVKGRAMREMQADQAKAERERMSAELEANQAASAQVVDAFVTQKELSQEDWTKLGTQIDTFIQEAVNGRISPQLLEVFYKGLNYETATQTARQDGVLAGRNEAVTKIQKQKAGDGLPSPMRKAASGVRATPQTHTDPIRDSIRQAASTAPGRFA